MTPDLRQRLIDLLERIQTVSTAASGDDQCPDCGPPGGSHAPECDLAACLQELRKAQSELDASTGFPVPRRTRRG